MLPWTIRRWLGLADPEPSDAPNEVVRPPNSAWHPDLARQLRESGDDAAFEAYAAWLEQNNDPRAHLIRGDHTPLDEHPALFLGPLFGEDGVEVVWKRGFWSSVSITREWGSPPAAPLVAALLEHPSAYLLDRLAVRADRAADVADVLTDCEPLVLRTLEVTAVEGLLGTWAAVWPRVPALETLVLCGELPQLGDIHLPELRSLSIDGPIDAGLGQSLLRMRTPKLQSLTVVGLASDTRAALEQKFGGVLR